MKRVTSEATDRLGPEVIQADIMNWLSAIATINTAKPVEPVAEWSAISSENPLAQGRWHESGRAIYSLWAPFWLNVLPIERGHDLEHVQYVGSTKIKPLENENVLYTPVHPFVDGTFIEASGGDGGIDISIQSETRERNTSMNDSSPLLVVDAVVIPVTALETVEFEVVKRRPTMTFDNPRV